MAWRSAIETNAKGRTVTRLSGDRGDRLEIHVGPLVAPGWTGHTWQAQVRADSGSSTPVITSFSVADASTITQLDVTMVLANTELLLVGRTYWADLQAVTGPKAPYTVATFKIIPEQDVTRP